MNPLAEERTRPAGLEDVVPFLVRNWETAQIKDGRTFKHVTTTQDYNAILAWLKSLEPRLAKRVLALHDINRKLPTGTFPTEHREMWVKWREAQFALTGAARGEDRLVAAEARHETIDWRNLVRPEEVAEVFKPTGGTHDPS